MFFPCVPTYFASRTSSKARASFAWVVCGVICMGEAWGLHTDTHFATVWDWLHDRGCYARELFRVKANTVVEAQTHRLAKRKEGQSHLLRTLHADKKLGRSVIAVL